MGIVGDARKQKRAASRALTVLEAELGLAVWWVEVLDEELWCLLQTIALTRELEIMGGGGEGEGEGE